MAGVKPRKPRVKQSVQLMAEDIFRRAESRRESGPFSRD